VNRLPEGPATVSAAAPAPMSPSKVGRGAPTPSTFGPATGSPSAIGPGERDVRVGHRARSERLGPVTGARR
jgi:hypothetical protein